MKTKDVFQRKWITDSITKRRYPFSDTFNDGPVVYLPFQTFLHIVHRLFQAAVHDPRIMLRHACGSMSEHDGHVLQGYIVGERDGGPESVPGKVETKSKSIRKQICARQTQPVENKRFFIILPYQ